MKRSTYTDEQILAIVKEGEAGRKVADLCRSHGNAAQFDGRTRRERTRFAPGERLTMRWRETKEQDRLCITDRLSKPGSSSADLFFTGRRNRDVAT